MRDLSLNLLAIVKSQKEKKNAQQAKYVYFALFNNTVKELYGLLYVYMLYLYTRHP